MTGIRGGAQSGPRVRLPESNPAGREGPAVGVSHSCEGDAIREARMRRVWKGIKERNRIG